MNNWRKTHPTCVCPSGEGFHFTIRPPDAADCAQAKEQPSTQNLILQGGSITVSLPWLSCWGPIVQYINFINMHLLNIMPIFFTREIYHTAWTYIFFKKETKPSRSPFHQWTRWPLWCVHHCCEGSGHRWDSPEQLCSGVSSRQVNDPPNERSNKTPRDEHMPYIYIYVYRSHMSMYERHPRCNTHVTQPKNLHWTYSISTPASYQSCPCPSIFLQPWVNRHVAVIEDQRLTLRPLPVMTGIRPQWQKLQEMPPMKVHG